MTEIVTKMDFFIAIKMCLGKRVYGLLTHCMTEAATYTNLLQETFLFKKQHIYN